jgi:hypothetical protein
MANNEDPHQTALAGMDADAAEASRLEAAVSSDPHDMNARTRLLGYYAQRSFADAGARRRRAAHCLWVIRHRPEAVIAGTPFCQIEKLLDPAGYRKAKVLWRSHIARRDADVAVLANAASFYTGHDKRSALSLYRRLQQIEPRNSKWPERLGHVHHLQSLRGPRRRPDRAACERALAEWETALRLLGTDVARFHLLPWVAPVALDAERTAKAARYARDLLRIAKKLSPGWNTGNAIHHAHSTLGRLALRDNRVAEAKRHLLASAKTQGSPQLNSFGPSWQLAHALLERGERKAVLRYLELCRAFWEMGRAQLDAWANTIRESGMTDFLPTYPPGPKS